VILVEPVEIDSPGAYVARVVSDVFIRDGSEYMVYHRPQGRGNVNEGS
jgi:hypothetical protein